VSQDNSNLFVRLSNIHSALRGDIAGEKNEDGAQEFVRKTTKYWIHKKDISSVKHLVLQVREGSLYCSYNTISRERSGNVSRAECSTSMNVFEFPHTETCHLSPFTFHLSHLPPFHLYAGTLLSSFGSASPCFSSPRRRAGATGR
jgi:SPX domain protein involved in polyphosphate accumulation